MTPEGGQTGYGYSKYTFYRDVWEAQRYENQMSLQKYEGYILFFLVILTVLSILLVRYNLFQ